MNNSILPILVVFIIYGLIIVIIAFLAKNCTKNLSDYILGGRSLSGVITALSAGASDMSSWLLMALPGAVYVNGINQIWLPVALLVGAYCNWKFIAKRLRIYTEIFDDSHTLPAYLCNRFKGGGKDLRVVTSLAIVIFFIFYSASIFVSGAILINTIFGINYLPSLLIIAAVVILYTTIGGFLAVSWIDFFQGTLMFLALIIVPTFGFIHLGGIQNVLHNISIANPTFLDVFANIKFLGIVSLFAWGLGYFGQPHINLRFMAIRSVKELPTARRICMSWMVLSLFGAVLTGLVGFIVFLSNPLDKSETVFIMLSHILFNPWITGILLSAIISAIMSTASAQILMVASILANDFYRGFFRKKASSKECLWAGRIFLILVACIAISIAARADTTIFKAVAFAWSGLGASFGPVIIFSLYWRNMTRTGAISGIFVGGMTVVLCEILSHLGIIFNHPDLISGINILPGFILSSITIIFVSKITIKPTQDIFDKFELALNNSKM